MVARRGRAFLLIVANNFCLSVNSVRGGICSQYVPYEGVTVMRFKVASRRFERPSVRRSSAARRCSGCAGRTASSAPAAAIAIACWRGAGSICNRCKKHIIFAADALVRSHSPDRDGEERHLVGGTRPPSRGTAWAVKHKIMAVMARRNAAFEMDDAYCALRRQSRWRRSRPVVKLVPVKGFRKREIGAKHWLAPGAAVVTDGLGCWSALDIACSHQAIRTGSGRRRPAWRHSNG